MQTCAKSYIKIVHISIICDSPKFEKPKCSSKHKLNCLFSYNGMLNINESEVIIATGNDADDHHKHSA